MSEQFWERFQESGSVEDYLVYAALKEIENADIERRRAGTETTERTGQIH